MGVAHDLPAQLAAALLTVAQDAFVHGMQVAAGISVVFAVGVAILALVMLRDIPSGTEVEAAAEAEDQRADEAQRHGRAAVGMGAAVPAETACVSS